jgi:hypothetical protein
MSDKKIDNKFETTEDIDENVSGQGNTGTQTIIYSFLILLTGLGFVIGALLAGTLVSGTLCVFETMTIFTSQMASLGGSGQSIQQIAINEYTGCLARSVFSPVTIIVSLIGGFVVGYPSYNIAQKIMSGRKLRTML